MKISLLILIVMMLAACANRIATKTLKQESDSTRLELMRKEASVTGDFILLRKFHQPLMNETAKPNAIPYQELDLLYSEIKANADSVIVQRIGYEKSFLFIDSISKAHKKIKEESAIGQQTSLHYVAGPLKNLMAGRYQKRFAEKQIRYYDLVDSAAIKRIGFLEYAENLNTKVVQWQDSLEEIGRMIAVEKLDLKTKFPEQKGDVFFGHYFFISELEALLKAFDGSIMQLQNSQSRFEGSNQEEYFYYGPHIELRREVQVTESILEDLSVEMQDCRAKQREYQDSYLPHE